MNIWRLIVHHEEQDRAITWIRLNQRIAIGWGKIGDLRQHKFRSGREIGAAIRRSYPELNNSGDGGSSLWKFRNEVRPGDLILLSGNKTRELVVEVQGDYEYEAIPILNNIPLSAEYQHQRRIRVTNWNPEEIWQKAGARPAVGESSRHTLMRYALPLIETPDDIVPVDVKETIPFTPANQDRVEVSETKGRNNKLTGQIGEFLVCAELGRRGFIATPFSGNVPGFDVIATDVYCRTVPIQVKASNHDNWPARAQQWMDIDLDEETGKQHLRGPKEIDNPQLIYVCVSIAKPESGNRDRFFILTKSDVQNACIEGYTEFMDRQGWKRPRNVASFDCRYFIPSIERFEDNWELIKLRVAETSPATSLNTAED